MSYYTSGFGFIPGLLEDTYKYIGVEGGNYVTSKQKGQVQIRMCNDNRNPFIATLHNVLLAPDLCDGLFSNLMLMIWDILIYFASGLSRCTLVIRIKICLSYHIFHRGNMNLWQKQRKCSSQRK